MMGLIQGLEWLHHLEYCTFQPKPFCDHISKANKVTTFDFFLLGSWQFYASYSKGNWRVIFKQFCVSWWLSGNCTSKYL